MITGPMYCGKSEELIRRIRRVKIARQAVKVFKPVIDDRYELNDVVSHSGDSIEAVPVSCPEEIFTGITDDIDVIAIDEVQFFGSDICEVVEELADSGKRIILAGLDRDFRGVPFGSMPELLARAEYVEKLHAICVLCGNPATRTQRLIEGQPASFDDPVIMIGASEVYEARCRKCHSVPVDNTR